MKELYVMGSPVKLVPSAGAAPPLQWSSSLELSMPKDTEAFQSLEVYFNKNPKIVRWNTAILSREKTRHCWVKLAKNESWKHLLLFPLADLAFQDFLLLSYQSSKLSWLPELQKTYIDPLRSPGKPSVGVLWCILMPWLLCACLSFGLLLQLDTSGCRCSLFCWKRRNLPYLLRTSIGPEGSSQEAACGHHSPTFFSKMYSMQWLENKVIKLPYPSVITFWVRLDLRKFFFFEQWNQWWFQSDLLNIYSPLCSPTHFSNPIFPVRAPR